jgi:hypothetical protein
MDFGKSGLNANRPGDTRQYDRYMIYLGVGYKYDLVKIVETTAGFIKNKIQNSRTRAAISAQEHEELQVPVEETEDETDEEEDDDEAAEEEAEDEE